ncbi:hypothetical protein F52700_12091 [Fusarium sp. NRRL 52700]|nr:hypothetical protein F52700_12091 [Fusarium sp. NRRL 52700]
MTVTEVGCMGVKPDMNIMGHTTPEGKILTDAWKTVISKPGGPQRVYWGLEAVDPSKIWGFFDFDSVEQHRRFAEEYGADAVKDIPKICTHGEFTKHIKMIPSSDVLGSPLTDIILAYFPQDISEKRKVTLSSKIQEILKRASSDEARVAHAWGVENDFPARTEDGQPRSFLVGFVGLSHSEAGGDYHLTDGWKQAVSDVEGLEGFPTANNTSSSQLGHYNVATSVQRDIKGAENVDGTSRRQLGFWTGTGLALIFITVQIQSAETELAAVEKAQREREMLAEHRVMRLVFGFRIFVTESGATKVVS